MEAPKRITRSRAKAGSDKAATKIVTAAAAAKKTAPAAPISRKRLRSDDADDDEDDDDDELGGAEPAQGATKLRTAARAVRGRPRKAEAVDETKPAEPAPAPKPRGRPAKKMAPAKEEPLAAAPVRATRTTRAKKTEPPLQPGEAAEPLKPATRARATTAATAAKATVKKSVKFEEPEKENTPPTAPKTKRVKAAAAEPPAPVAAEPVTTGLRARPLRRAAAAAAPLVTARATRGSAKPTPAPAAAQKEERPATPLGPKRITQLTRAKKADRGDESDDELAGDDTASQRPLLMKSPVRPAPAVRPELELPLPTPAAEGEEMPTLNNPPDLAITAATNLLSSPARRPAASPYKDTIKSPARRGVGAPLLALPEGGSIASQDIKSPLKTSLLFSPAKRPKSPMKTMQAAATSLGDVSRSPMKASLLNSPAKRLFSPAKPKHRDEAKKVEENEEEEKENEEEQQPAEMEFRSPATEPVLLTTPIGLDAEYRPAAARQAQMLESPTRQLFPGRLSAVLPRHADPALKDTVMGVVARVNAEQAASQEEEEAKPEEEVYEEIESVAGEAMDVDEPAVQVASEENASTRPGFGLRQKDLDPYAGVDSESDDEVGTPAVTASSGQARAIQTPSRSTRQAGRGLSLGVQSSSKSVIKKTSESSGHGFTPLAEKLNGWRASSPRKVGTQSGPPALVSAVAVEAREETFICAEQVSAAGAQDSPAKSTFFDDEMLVRADFQIEESAVVVQEQQLEMEVDEPELGDLPITQEDVELAAEAHEMSLLDQSRLEEKLCAETGMDDSISEASQEYGDENQTPIDPALMMQDQQPSGSASPGVPPVTPQRFVTRTFHTVSKIPLKPADESTPRSALAEAKQSRRHSVAKLPGATTPTRSRPNNDGLARNATVISYSPTKADRQAEEADEVEEKPRTTSAPVTPVRSESGFSWSTTGTPARTPRRDVNPALLRGAVVFVDVRTSEGADSSDIFVELLSQMGAVCLRSWDWTPDEAESVSKVGITHVVFKDGSNQTIQKVRECGGVVQCVGVSWVLE